MKFLIIGLGSMGQRRIRCLKALGYHKIIGFDLREDRRKLVSEKYATETIGNLTDVKLNDFSAMIISTPPDLHTSYAKMAVENSLPVFIEASVLLDDVLYLKEFNTANSYIAPSCTLRFHPTIRDIKSLIKSGKYGSLSNFSYHSGQFLPDWHPWEDVKDFYVSKRLTGGAREIVPFELTWLTDVFGFPIATKGYFAQTIDVGAEIEDSYVFNMKFDKGLGSVIIDVTSRFATRNLVVNLEKAQLRWNWEENNLKIFEMPKKRWIVMHQPEFIADQSYNKNIGEQMYIDEISAFINGFSNMGVYPNTIDDDIKILELLNQIENSDGGFTQ